MDGDNQQGHGSLGNKRRRARKACIPCRQRKRKCDGSSPCEMCSAYGYSCQFDEDDSPLAPFVAHPQKRAKGSEQRDATANGGAGSNGRNTDGSGAAGSPNADSPMTVSSRRRPRSTSPAFDGGLLDETKSRYVGVSSAVAFPRVLGLELKSKNPPPLHSFGYNFGIRPEEKTDLTGEDLCDFIGEDELLYFSNVYFSVLGLVFDVLDQRVYNQRCRDYYKYESGEKDKVFGAVAASVAAVGSFLSTNQGHSRELDLVQFSKRVLEDPTSTRRPSVDQVTGWAVRTIYLRATTRPNNSWLASCISMHIAEAIGLHEEENVIRLASSASATNIGHTPERLRRVFWLAWTNHVIISHEYGRSAVRFPHVTCEDISPMMGTYAHLQVRLAQIIPSPNSPWTPDGEPADVKEDIYARIKAASEVPSGIPFIALTKADIIFCFYRRLRQNRWSVSNEIIDLIISAGNDAVDAAAQGVKEGRPFWNILGSVFQYSCVLLAIDTPASLANVNRAFEGLEIIVRAADTKLTREALATARLLLRDTISKKRQDLASLEAADKRDDAESTDDSLQGLGVDLPPDLDLGLNWDQFFSESYNPLMGHAELMGQAAFANGAV